MESKEKIRSHSHFAYHREFSKAILGKTNNARSQSFLKYPSLQDNVNTQLHGSLLTTAACSYDILKRIRNLEPYTKQGLQPETTERKRGNKDTKEVTVSKCVSQSRRIPNKNRKNVPTEAGDGTKEKTTPLSKKEDYGTLVGSSASFDRVSEERGHRKPQNGKASRDFHIVREDHTFASHPNKALYHATEKYLPYAISNGNIFRPDIGTQGNMSKASYLEEPTKDRAVDENLSPDQFFRKPSDSFPLHKCEGNTQNFIKQICEGDCHKLSLSRFNPGKYENDMNATDDSCRKDKKVNLTYLALPKLIRSDWSSTILSPEYNRPNIYEQQKSNQKVAERATFSNTLLSLERNYYVKRDDIRGPLQIHKHILKNEKNIIYNPYYAFLPEYTNSRTTSIAKGTNQVETRGISAANPVQSLPHFPFTNAHPLNKNIEFLSNADGSCRKKSQDDRLSLRKTFLQDTEHFLSYLKYESRGGFSNTNTGNVMNSYRTSLRKYEEPPSTEITHAKENMKTGKMSNKLQNQLSSDTIRTKIEATLALIKKPYDLPTSRDVTAKEQYSHTLHGKNSTSVNVREFKNENGEGNSKTLGTSVTDTDTLCISSSRQEVNENKENICETDFYLTSPQVTHTRELPDKSIENHLNNDHFLKRTTPVSTTGSPSDVPHTEETIGERPNNERKGETQSQKSAQANKRKELGERDAHCAVLQPPTDFANQESAKQNDSREDYKESEEHEFNSRALSSNPEIEVDFPLFQCQYGDLPACERGVLSASCSWEKERPFYAHSERPRRVRRSSKERKPTARGADFGSPSPRLAHCASSQLSQHKWWWGDSRHMEGSAAGEEGDHIALCKEDSTDKGHLEAKISSQKGLFPNTHLAAGESFVFSTPIRTRMLRPKHQHGKRNACYRKIFITRQRRQINNAVKKSCKSSHSLSAPAGTVRRPCTVQNDKTMHSKLRLTSINSSNLTDLNDKQRNTDRALPSTSYIFNTRGVKVADYTKFVNNDHPVFLFSWEEPVVHSKINPDDTHKHSYALLYWSDVSAPAKSAKCIFSDLIRRIICEMECLSSQSNVQSKGNLLYQNVRNKCNVSPGEHHAPRPSYFYKGHRTAKDTSTPKTMDIVPVQMESNINQSLMRQKESAYKCDSQFKQRHCFPEYYCVDDLKIPFGLHVTRKRRKRKHQSMDRSTSALCFNKTVTLDTNDVALTQTLHKLFISPSGKLNSVTCQSEVTSNECFGYSHFSRKSTTHSWCHHNRSIDTYNKLFHTLDVLYLAGLDKAYSSDDESVCWSI